MKRLSIREIRASLPRLEDVLAQSGTIEVTRHGRPIARLSAVAGLGKLPSHADIRRRIPRLSVASEVHIRAERDER
ncbi:MAG: prevent-host-death protein [Alphaproteobacteria bacterium]|nr:prevent-host-death protein [Alphaproteobacteria bacterium]